MIRFTEVRTNGNSTWRTGSWIWTGETMSSPKPSGMLSGEVDKKKKKKKQTKQQERELCNSFYPVNRHFNILPYPVTGLISGNFFWDYENWQTQRTVRYCKPGCRQEYSTRLVGEGESLQTVIFIFLPPGVFTFFPLIEFSHCKISIFTSNRCSGPGWPDLPRHRRSEVVHHDPVDEKQTPSLMHCSRLTGSKLKS